MFKKLKEKITEEVKISPQRFVEFSQLVSDRLQNSSTSDDNFFSIGDDDANSSIDNSYGFSSVQLVSPSQERNRKNSTSSLASDVSFLPKYEPTNMYHLQSDLEVSASEIEDNVSTASSQLGHLSKEQIYSAFQKSQMRYHKYRGRYTDLTRHYKDLERENVKMKGVLVETQDKAIRRVTELKEQCALEQKAKAHLESALRDDIDEKDFKIKTLKTQIEYLQNDKSSNNLVNLEENGNNSSENLENLTKYLNESRKEIENLNAKIQELKANAIVFQSKEQEYKSKISNLEKELVQFSEREKENNLNLAQNKMELHNEILLKDTEITNLKRDNENLKLKLESVEIDSKSNSNQKLENLQSQNTKLIEKIESLTQKSNNLESELIKMETFKIEINNLRQKQDELEKHITHLTSVNTEISKLNSELNDSLQKEKQSYETQIASLREDAKKGLLSLEPKIREKLQVEFSEREEQLREEFSHKVEEISSISNTSKEIQLQLFEKDNIIKKINEQLNETNSELSKKKSAYANLEKDHLELIEDCTKLRDSLSNIEKDKLALESYEEKVERLEAHINTLQEELKISQENCSKADKELTNVKESLANTTKELKILAEKNEHLKYLDANVVLKLKTLEEENVSIFKQNELEKEILSKTITELNDQIKHLKENLEKEKEQTRINIKNNADLETKLEEMEEKIRLFEMKENAMSVEKNEMSLLQLKLKELEKTLENNVDSVEKEHKSISEDLDNIKKELNLTEENSVDEFTESGLKSKLGILKDMCNKKDRQYRELLLKQSNLGQENLSIRNEVETLRSEISNIQSTNYEFQIKIQNLDDTLNKTNVLLEEKNIEINNLKQKLYDDQNKISDLENLLSSERIICKKYSDENDHLQSELKELEEKYKLMLVKDEGLQLEKSEYNLLKLKIQKLEEEHCLLQQLYEEENASYEKNLKENQETINKFTNHNLQVSRNYENEKTNVEKLNKKLHELEETLRKAQQEKLIELQKINDFNQQFEKEKDEEIFKLSSNIANLNNTIEKQNVEFKNLLSQTQQLDTMVEKLKSEKDDALKYEKEEKKQLELKIKALNTDLDKKVQEIDELKQNILDLKNMYKGHQEKYEQHLAEVADLNKKLKNKISDLNGKDQEIYILNAERDSLLEEITTLRSEIEDLNRDISQRGNNDKKLIYSENEKEALKIEQAKIKEEITQLNKRIQQLSLDNRNIIEENQNLCQEKEELKIALEILKEDQNTELENENLKKTNVTLTNAVADLTNQISKLQNENAKLKNKVIKTSNEKDIANIQQEFYEIKGKCDDLFMENKNLKLEYHKLEEKCNNFGRIKEKLESQISDLERHYNEILREKQLLEDEVQELKTTPVNYHHNSKLDNLEMLKKEQCFLKESERQHYITEMESLSEKLTKYKSLDLTNKSSIEFYENELQKMKNQNDKLNRKLDETLVTLNHCTELSTSTEVEYLKNVLYNYMLGKESLVLARVIAAVCKFDPQQTELILQKEQQKQTLLGQLGLI